MQITDVFPRTKKRSRQHSSDRFIPTLSQSSRDAYQKLIPALRVASTLGLSSSKPVLQYQHTTPKRKTKITIQSPPKDMKAFPLTPELILDAPGLVHAQTLDWSVNNVVMIGLESKCYLWTQKDGLYDALYTSQTNITCSAFSLDGKRAIVSDERRLLLFDIPTMNSAVDHPLHSTRFTMNCCTWVDHNTFVTGSSRLTLWDVRTFSPAHIFSNDVNCVSVSGHTIASSSKELDFWDLRQLQLPKASAPITCKSLSFCPWQPSLLACGGQELVLVNDHGKVLEQTSFNCTDLVWSKHYRELVTCSTYEFIRWDLSLNRLASAEANDPLKARLSPDAQTVAVLSRDETLKFWKWFPTKRGQKPLKPISVPTLLLPNKVR